MDNSFDTEWLTISYVQSSTGAFCQANNFFRNLLFLNISINVARYQCMESNTPVTVNKENLSTFTVEIKRENEGK